MSHKVQRIIDRLETLLDNIEKLNDDISLMCIDARNQIDKYNELEHTEDFPELDEFNKEDIDEEEDK
jgi:hypothetical protein